MNIQVCDGGCGKTSPDEKMLHVANHWFIVRVSRVIGTSEVKERLLCPECFAKAAPILDGENIRRGWAASSRTNLR